MDRKLSKNLKIVAGVGAASFAAGVFLDWNNTALQLTKYDVQSENLPSAFDGFKIVHISDFHNFDFLSKRVFRFAEGEKPDIIVITGDLFDCRRTDVPVGLAMAERLTKIAPVYMVCGNHEARMSITPMLKEELTERGVNIIENKQVPVEIQDEKITLAGIADPRAFAGENLSYDDKRNFAHRVEDVVKDIEGYKILLCHRPDFFLDYRELGIDLVFSGHAHGGQFGVPFTDIGLYLPSQGLFPKYAAGKKQKDNTTMIISRGIGNSQFPFRLFNLPEVVSVTLKSK